MKHLSSPPAILFPGDRWGRRWGGKRKREREKICQNLSALQVGCGGRVCRGREVERGGIREREFVIVPTRKEGVDFFLFLGTPINHRSEEEEEEEATSNLFAAGDQDEIGGGKEKSTIPARKRFLFCGGL